MQTHTHQGMRGRQLITHQKNNCGCQSIWVQAEKTNTRRPRYMLRALGRDVSTPHNMTSILETNQSMNDRLIARKLAAWPIRFPFPPTHTVTWQASKRCGRACILHKKKKQEKLDKMKLAVPLIGGTTISRRFVVSLCLQNINPNWRLQTDKSVLSFQMSDVSKSHYKKLNPGCVCTVVVKGSTGCVKMTLGEPTPVDICCSKECQNLH